MSKQPVKIWINRAGPSRIHAMRMLRANPDGRPVVIHATRTRADNPSQKFADVPGNEPGSEATDAEYGSFAVAYVRAHGIQAIIPTARMSALAAQRDELTALGCTLLAPSVGVCDMADSKFDTYRVASSLGLKVPDFHAVSSASGFYSAVAKIQDAGHVATVKPDTGWAASGFRIITPAPPTLEELTSGKPYVHVDTYADALAQHTRSDREPADLIVMPYLDNPEISVDVLCEDGEPLITIPRTKNGFYRDLDAPKEVIDQAYTLVRKLKLNHLVNIQFRQLDGSFVLLEINPRPSAGTFHTEASGVNLYWEAVKRAVVGHGAVPVPKLGARVLLQETAVTL